MKKMPKTMIWRHWSIEHKRETMTMTRRSWDDEALIPLRKTMSSSKLGMKMRAATKTTTHTKSGAVCRKAPRNTGKGRMMSEQGSLAKTEMTRHQLASHFLYLTRP